MAGAKNKRSTEPPGQDTDAVSGSIPAFSSSVDSSIAADPVRAALAAFFAPRCSVFAEEPGPARHLSAAPRLCVAFSGGRDSVVLLDALSRLSLLAGYGVPLSALHVHHGLSPHADDWVDFCADFCAARSIPLTVVKVRVAHSARQGPEAAAREARYRAFAAHGCDWLALAHHTDDQAETMLLNLLRGAGVQGAAAMPEERLLNASPTSSGPGVRLLRPFLSLPRVALETYAKARELTWVDDESNTDSKLTRNYLRREVMPLITARFPAAGQALVRAAAHFSESAELLAAVAEEDRRAVSAESGRMPGGMLIRERFLNLPLARARNLLRHEFLRRGRPSPPTRWLDEALRQLRAVGADSRLQLGHDAIEIRLYRDGIYFLPLPQLSPVPRFWQGEMELPWDSGNVRGWVRFVDTEGTGLSRALLQTAPVCLMPRRGGEHLRLNTFASRRSLKNLLREAAFPPWERAALPLLWCGERLVWVGGTGSDCSFLCPPGAPGIEVIWERD